MGLFSKFKKKRRTNQAGFRDYQSRPTSRRKPIKVKKERTGVTLKLNRREERKRNRIKFALRLFLLIAGSILIIYILAGTRLFEIRSVEIQGDAETLDEQAFVQSYLEDQLGKNMLSFSGNIHEDALLEEYPYLKGVKVKRVPFHTIRAELITYEQITNVQMIFEDGSKKFYVLNELGYISSVGLQNESLPTIVMDVTGTDLDLPENQESLKVNQELLSPGTLQLLLKTKNDFEGRFNMQIFEVHYLKRAREIHLLTERFFYVWFDSTQDLNLQMGKLKKALTQVNIYEADLEYIDLRISGQNGEKVIYKLNQ